MRATVSGMRTRDRVAIEGWLARCRVALFLNVSACGLGSCAGDTIRLSVGSPLTRSLSPQPARMDDLRTGGSGSVFRRGVSCLSLRRGSFFIWLICGPLSRAAWLWLLPLVGAL